jgi:hypothetical protein
LTVDFVVCTLTVGRKKNQSRFRHVASDHSLVSLASVSHGTHNHVLLPVGSGRLQILSYLKI